MRLMLMVASVLAVGACKDKPAPRPTPSGGGSAEVGSAVAGSGSAVTGSGSGSDSAEGGSAAAPSAPPLAPQVDLAPAKSTAAITSARFIVLAADGSLTVGVVPTGSVVDGALDRAAVLPGAPTAIDAVAAQIGGLAGDPAVPALVLADRTASASALIDLAQRVPTAWAVASGAAARALPLRIAAPRDALRTEDAELVATIAHGELTLGLERAGKAIGDAPVRVLGDPVAIEAAAGRLLTPTDGAPPATTARLRVLRLADVEDVIIAADGLARAGVQGVRLGDWSNVAPIAGTSVTVDGATLTVAPPTTTGGVDPAAVSAALVELAPQFAACYRTHGRGHHGSVLASWLVLPGGKLGASTVVGFDDDVAACAKTALQARTWPAPKGKGRGEVSARLAFAPAAASRATGSGSAAPSVP